MAYTAAKMRRDLAAYYARQATEPVHGTQCDCAECERARLRAADQRA